MTPKYVPILRAKKGEFDAYEKLSETTRANTLAVFELPKLTNKMLESKTYSLAENPYEVFVRKCGANLRSHIGDRTIGIDIHSWAPHFSIETGEHILSSFFNALTSEGCDVIPVIGYDRWEDIEYSTVLKLIARNTSRFILRLDSYAFEDMIEEDLFEENLEDIISSMGLDTSQCSVILDFGDVTKSSIIDMESQVNDAFSLLEKYQFSYISIAGCSITPDINGMVSAVNSAGVVIRKELQVWKLIKSYNPKMNFVFGDYGIVNPNIGDDIIAPDANGKIRYTISDSYFVVRGYSRRQHEKGAQMHGLCKLLVNSTHFCGSNFSWGDSIIELCSNYGKVKGKIFVGNPTNWVSIDTSHHITFVTSEVFEFEQSLIGKHQFEFSS